MALSEEKLSMVCELDAMHDEALTLAIGELLNSKNKNNMVVAISCLRTAGYAFAKIIETQRVPDELQCDLIQPLEDYFHYCVHVATSILNKKKH